MHVTKTSVRFCLAVLLDQKRNMKIIEKETRYSQKKTRHIFYALDVKGLTGAYVYLAVETKTQQHDKEQWSPELIAGHGGENFRVNNKHQTRT